MTLLLRDLRTAARSLRRHPWESLMAAAALAFGLGLSATLFAVARAAYLRGLPLPRSERIMSVQRADPEKGHPFGAVEVNELMEWRRAQRSFEGLVAWAYSNVTLRAPGASARRYTLCLITADSFDVLGIRPALGRGLLASDGAPDATRVVVLSHRVWTEQFNGDARVLGREVFLGDDVAQIVGVLGPEQRFPFNQDLWATLPVTQAAVGGWAVQVAGRLRENVAPEAAGSELTALARARSPKSAVAVSPFTRAYTGELRRTIRLLLAAAVLLLLLAAASVSHLLIARGLVRRQELAVCAALGASRRRLAVRALWEALAVAVLGSGVGLALASVATSWLSRSGRETLWMYWIDLRLDLPTVGVEAGLALLTALAAAALPAWHTLRVAPAAVLQQDGNRVGSRQLGWAARSLVVLQVAVSAALLVSSALLWRTLQQASRIDAGRDPGHVLTADLFAPNANEAKLATALPRFENALLADAAVASVAEASDVPGGGTREEGFEIERRRARGGSGEPLVSARSVTMSPQLPRVLGMDLLTGRAFSTHDDSAAAPVALVNRSFAERAFPQQAIGQRLRVGGTAPWRTVVGVVADTVLGGPESRLPCVYLPVQQAPTAFLHLVVRTRTPPHELAARLPQLLAAVDPDVAVAGVRTLPERLAEATAPERLLSRAFAVFATGATILALLGLYGVLSFNVRSGRRDLGLRAALGAGRGALFAFVCSRGARDLALGAAVGVALAAAGARLLSSSLYGVTVWDPWSWGAAFTILLAGGLISCAVPAWRAAGLQPAAALRAG